MTAISLLLLAADGLPARVLSCQRESATADAQFPVTFEVYSDEFDGRSDNGMIVGEFRKEHGLVLKSAVPAWVIVDPRRVVVQAESLSTVSEENRLSLDGRSLSFQQASKVLVRRGSRELPYLCVATRAK